MPLTGKRHAFFVINSDTYLGLSDFLIMPIITKTTSETLDELVRKLETGRPTFYTRFGDGDLYLLMRKSYRNHQYNEDIRREMEESILLEDSHFLKAMCVNYELESGMKRGLFTFYPDNNEMADFLSSTYSPNTDWVFGHHFTFPYYSIFKQAEFIAFMEKHVRSKRKLFIGGVEKEVAEKLFGKIHEYVKTPLKNAYSEIDKWWPEVQERSQKVELVIPTAGAASKIINKRLWQENYAGNSIDIGALVDWVNGSRSRKWIKLKGHKINDVLVPGYENTSIRFKAYYNYRESYYALREYWKKIREI